MQLGVSCSDEAGKGDQALIYIWINILPIFNGCIRKIKDSSKALMGAEQQLVILAWPRVQISRTNCWKIEQKWIILKGGLWEKHWKCATANVMTHKAFSVFLPFVEMCQNPFWSDTWANIFLFSIKDSSTVGLVGACKKLIGSPLVSMTKSI